MHQKVWVTISQSAASNDDNEHGLLYLTAITTTGLAWLTI